MKICAPLLADTGGKATNGMTELDFSQKINSQWRTFTIRI